MPDQIAGQEYVELIVQFKVGNAASWITLNPTLAEGEPGYERDTGLLKIGDGVTDWINLDYFNSGSVGGGGGFTQEEIEDIVGNLVVAGTGIQKNYNDALNILTISLSGVEYTSVEKNKLSNIQDGAQVNPTDSEIVTSINNEIGSTDWQQSRTDEEIMDVIGAMINAGTQTNITVTYDDINNKIDFFVAASGGGGVDQEAVEDIVGSMVIGGTGISRVYDDVAGTLTINLADERFTVAEKNKLAAIEAGATADQTAAETSITDAGGYFVAVQVEAALQELAASAHKSTVVSTNGTSQFNGTLQNGSQTLFSVPQGSYVPGSLLVFLASMPLVNGWGLTETNPAAGTFTLDTPPESYDILIAKYSYTV